MPYDTDRTGLGHSGNVRNRYVSDGAGVVPPAKLLLMLYDRLVLDLERADKAIGENDLIGANDNLLHAQSIVLELHAALDTNAWDGAAGLSQLYLWFNNELMNANIRKEVKGVRTCLNMVRELRDTWHQAYDQMLASPAPKAAQAPVNAAG